MPSTKPLTRFPPVMVYQTLHPYNLSFIIKRLFAKTLHWQHIEKLVTSSQKSSRNGGLSQPS